MFRSTKFLGCSMAPRRNRRVMVVAVYLAIALLPLIQAVRHPTELYRNALILVLLMASFFARHIFGAIVPALTWNDRYLEMADSRQIEIVSVIHPGQNKPVHESVDPDPDEREVAVRNSVYFAAFRWLAVYSVLIWLATMALLNPHMPFGVHGMVMMEYAMFPLMVMALTLPQAIILWNEPDLPEEA